MRRTDNDTKTSPKVPATAGCQQDSYVLSQIKIPGRHGAVNCVNDVLPVGTSIHLEAKPSCFRSKDFKGPSYG